MMQIMTVAHHDPCQPTMSFHGEMNNKTIRKIQFGGYTKRSYKEIRRTVKRRIEKELNIKLK